MWCPDCGSGYVAGVARCADCGSELVVEPSERVTSEYVSAAGRPVQVAGIGLQCQHCGYGRFVKRKAQLNTAFLSFLDLDWLNQTGTIFLCGRCGFLHWFLTAGQDMKVGRIGAADAAGERPFPPELEAAAADFSGQEGEGEPFACLACGTPIPAGDRSCGECGWSYG